MDRKNRDSILQSIVISPTIAPEDLELFASIPISYDYPLYEVPPPSRGIGFSPLETALNLPPIADEIFTHLHTPSLLILRGVSRTLRNIITTNPRYFRNLTFLRPGGEIFQPGLRKEKALDWTDNDFNFQNRGQVLQILVDEIAQKQNTRVWDRLHDEIRGVQAILRFLQLRATGTTRWGMEMAMPWIRILNQLKKRRDLMRIEGFQRKVLSSESEHWYPHLMGRHLQQILNSLPLGRWLQTLVLDGTGVSTHWVQGVLARFGNTLRGLSIRGCRNMEPVVVLDWIFGMLRMGNPISLQWLRMWGMGGMLEFFNCHYIHTLQQADEHPDDKAAGTVPSILSIRAHNHANLIPEALTIYDTVECLIPMFKRDRDRENFRRRLIGTIIHHYRRRREQLAANKYPFAFSQFEAPIEPLRDIHPVISLLTLAKYLKIDLDYSLCASQKYCWSFYLAAQANSPPPRRNAVSFFINRVNTTYSFPDPNARNNVQMHTHAIAEIGFRKRSGGQVCDMCGLWENSCAPEHYREDTKSDSYGGITFGPAIGIGRMSIGQLCTDCIMMQTCSSCNKFYCHNCVFSQADNVNPLMADIIPQEYVTHMRVKCDLHLPECDECLGRGDEMNGEDEEDDTAEGLPGRGDLVSGLFECDECRDAICLRCEAPFGTKTLTDAFGGMNLKEALSYTRIHSSIEYRMMVELPFHNTDYRHLKALKGVHELASITTIRMFERCEGCGTELCMECIMKDRREIRLYTGPFQRPRNFSWYEVCIVCQARYCGECAPNHMNDCKSCDVWVCDECDMREVYSTPVFLFDDFHGGKCPDLVYSDLEGCWEETGEDDKIVSLDTTRKKEYQEEELGASEPVGTFEQDVSLWPGQTTTVHLTDFFWENDYYDEDEEGDEEEDEEDGEEEDEEEYE